MHGKRNGLDHAEIVDAILKIPDGRLPTATRNEGAPPYGSCLTAKCRDLMQVINAGSCRTGQTNRRNVIMIFKWQVCDSHFARNGTFGKAE